MSDMNPPASWSGYNTPDPDVASDYSSSSSPVPVKRSPPLLLLNPPSPKRFCITSSSVKDEPYPADSDVDEVDIDDIDDDDASDDDAVSGPGGDKFTKSRAVGQSHRDNEKEHVVALLKDVGFLRTENVLLFALFCDASHNERGLSISLRRIMQMTTRDRPEDHHLTDSQARARGMHRLAAPTNAILGMKYISTSMAFVLLEFLGIRRNLITSAPDPGRRRRRRGSFRAAPTVAQANEICQYALGLFRDDAARLRIMDRHAFVDGKMGALAVALHRWSEHEKRNNPAPFDAEDDEEFSDPPSSPTRPEAAEFGSPSRRRGEGAKRCSRCNMLKYTGSGHGRSKCDDGYSISSIVPYPASPRGEDGNVSN